MSADMGIDGRQRIIEKNNVSIVISCPSNVDSRLLASRDSYTTLANLSRVAVGKHVKICFECTIADDTVVLLLIECGAEEDVIPYRGILHPCRLRTKPDSPAQFDGSLCFTHFTNEGS